MQKKTNKNSQPKETVKNQQKSRKPQNMQKKQQKKSYSKPRNGSAKKYSKKQINETPVRIAFLGGLNEVGKNMTVIEYENDMIVVDCGLAFPEEDMLGVDLVIPDITYLEQNASRIRGIFLTHGHEDHIGALPYVLRSIQPPIFGGNRYDQNL